MKKKIINLSELDKILKSINRKEKKIVHCHGVFDVLHIGHLKHFKSAKNYGDILIISVTPDKFVQKGFARPYFNSEQRMESLASIEVIDYVVLDSSANAVNIINKIKPNFYAKGQDYKYLKKILLVKLKMKNLP